MARPLRIEEYFHPSSEPEEQPRILDLAPTLEVLERWVKFFEHEAEDTRVARARLVEKAKGVKDPEVLTRSINDLLRYEKKLAAKLLPVCDLLEESRRATDGSDSTLLQDYASLLTRGIQAISSTLCDLQDCRLELNVLRARVEKRGDAPIFDDVDELMEFLESQ